MKYFVINTLRNLNELRVAQCFRNVSRITYSISKKKNIYFYNNKRKPSKSAFIAGNFDNEQKFLEAHKIVFNFPQFT